MRTPNPCYKCEERHQGCHAVCPKYQEWHEIHKNEREAERRHRVEEYEYVAYMSEVKKQKERRNHYRKPNK